MQRENEAKSKQFKRKRKRLRTMPRNCEWTVRQRWLHGSDNSWTPKTNTTDCRSQRALEKELHKSDCLSIYNKGSVCVCVGVAASAYFTPWKRSNPSVEYTKRHNRAASIWWSNVDSVSMAAVATKWQTITQQQYSWVGAIAMRGVERWMYRVRERGRTVCVVGNRRACCLFSRKMFLKKQSSRDFVGVCVCVCA